jgi:hypothetical protein
MQLTANNKMPKKPHKRKQEWVDDIVALAKEKEVELTDKQIANMESKVIIPTLKTFYDLLKQS